MQAKRHPAYGFAYEPDSVVRQAFDRGRPKYGRDAVIFRAFGVRVRHFADEEYQVVFWQPQAHDIMRLHMESRNEWKLYDDDSELLVESSSHDEIVGWLDDNYESHKKNITVSNNPGRPRRRNNPRISLKNAVSVDPETYRRVLCKAENFDEITNFRDYDWWLMRKYPLKRLKPVSREWYEAECTSDEDVQQNLDRYDAIMDALNAGGKLWPVAITRSGFVLDGYHRMAVANDLGIAEIDLLVVGDKKKTR